MSEFEYLPVIPPMKDTTEYELVTTEHVRVEKLGGREFLVVEPAALTLLARRAFHDIAFFQRPAHNAQLGKILSDPQSTPNDKFVASALLTNAAVAAEEVLPLCQDTGTATVVAKKGQYVLTEGSDEEALSRGAWETYATDALRYSLVAPLTVYDEKNTGNNMPAQLDIQAVPGQTYEFLFMAKGGGSTNKTFMFQENRTLLSPEKLVPYLVERMKPISTAACPPNHLGIVIGGTSPEVCLKTVKLATAGYYDDLPTSGSADAHAFRDRELEEQLFAAGQALGFGAQWGGRAFLHDVRVIRMPRHAASCLIGMGVSCSAHRNAKGKITRDGIAIERLDRNPGRWLPEKLELGGPPAVAIDLSRPMPQILAELSRYPVKTRLSLTGKIVVGRDMVHARIKARLDAGQPMPDYLKNHPVFYVGPAKTPPGAVSGSLGPTSSSRMDAYVDLFQSHGGSMVMIGKGNRAPIVTEACKRHGGFYLGAIGGAAAALAKHHVKGVRTLEFPELGMEAAVEVEVENLPAVILIDDKGNDFFGML